MFRQNVLQNFAKTVFVKPKMTFRPPSLFKERAKFYLRREEVLVVLEEEELRDLSVHLGPGDAAQPDVLHRHLLHLVDGVPERRDGVAAVVRR